MTTLQSIKTIEQNGNFIHFIPTKKFKTIHFILKSRDVLSKETITKRALLTNVLREGTKKKPNRHDLEKRLDDLYGARLTIDRTKRGTSHIITFNLTIPNELFLPKKENLVKEAFALLQEVLYEPNVSEGKFPTNVFKIEKENLHERIISIKDDKTSYAQMRLLDTMCENEPYRLHVNGYVDDLNDLTNEMLYSYYKEMIKKDRFDLYILGDFIVDDLKQEAKSFFKVKSEHTSTTNLPKIEKKIIKVKEKIEYDQIQQAKLHIGYRTNCTFEDEEYKSLLVFNGLFGGLPSSKLFLNVREKNSLAYYVASQLESYNGYMFVYSGIAAKNYEKTVRIIDKELDNIKNGNFTVEQLNETIEQLVNDYLEVLDHPRGIVEFLYQQIIGNKLRTPEQLINELKTVTKEDVINIANKIEKDTVYLLSEKGVDVDEKKTN